MSQRWLKAYNVSITTATEELHGTTHTSASCSAIQDWRRWIYILDELSASELFGEKEKQGCSHWLHATINLQHNVLHDSWKIHSKGVVHINEINESFE